MMDLYLENNEDDHQEMKDFDQYLKNIRSIKSKNYTQQGKHDVHAMMIQNLDQRRLAGQSPKEFFLGHRESESNETFSVPNKSWNAIGNGIGNGKEENGSSHTHMSYYDSDSPISMDDLSQNEFDEEEQEEEQEEEEHGDEDGRKRHESILKSKSHDLGDSKKKKHFSSENALEHLNDYEKYSNQIDVLITFLKGQTHLYSFSEYLTQQRINYLTIPSFLFSIVITILAPLIHDYYWSGILISALTAFITSAMGCVRFYNLDSNVTSYLNLANQYNKMQTSLEMLSNSLFMDMSHSSKNDQKMIDKIYEIEQKISEIKESNTCFPPNEVKTMIPIIYHINIFAFIKKIELLKSNMISKYKKIKKEMKYIMNKWKKNNIDQPYESFEKIDLGSSIAHYEPKINEEKNSRNDWHEEEVRMNRKILWKQKQQQYKREKKRLNHLYQQKMVLRKEFQYYVTAYSYIDELFTKEIALASQINHHFFTLNFYHLFFGVAYQYVSSGNNPVVDNYLKFIFTNRQEEKGEKEFRKNLQSMNSHFFSETALPLEYQIAMDTEEDRLADHNV